MPRYDHGSHGSHGPESRNSPLRSIREIRAIRGQFAFRIAPAALRGPSATRRPHLRSYNRRVRCVSLGDHARWPALRAPPSIGLLLAIAGLAACLVMRPAAAACPGDCDGDGTVGDQRAGQRRGHRARAVAVVAMCSGDRQQRHGRVTIGELIAAVNALLDGCPGAPDRHAASTRTPPVHPHATHQPHTASTSTARRLPTASSTARYSRLPDSTCAVGATDPGGRRVQCAVENCPPARRSTTRAGVLSWTPTDEQLGAVLRALHVHRRCRAATSAAGAADVRGVRRSMRARSRPATRPPGVRRRCRRSSQPCCGGGPAARVAEPVAECPAGPRAVHRPERRASTFRSAAELRSWCR